VNGLKERIAQIKNEFTLALSQAITQEQLEQVRIEFLGRKGKLAELMPLLKTLSDNDKRELGPIINQLKAQSEELFEKKRLDFVSLSRRLQDLKTAKFDVTSYVPQQYKGSLHPYTHVINELESLFTSMGFEIVDGPELEEESYNFDALNIPSDHPARDMQDTFWLPFPGRLLRTHTSNVQIHEMKKRTPPLSIVSVGRAFRYEATDASHDYLFLQCEGLLIRESTSMAELFATMKTFLQQIFGKKELALRIRPGYFPFVEPGIEIDVQCPFCTAGCSTCKKSRWIESSGAGLVHPNVLSQCGIDSSKYCGFAFGFGLTRLVMLKYGINDIRLLHNNSIEFLEQFT
jgi:phenylalanyl-tRNA synthetase alpha chain